jgi:HAD superfamily phosphoserine phosphatase-like hydrolase
MSQRKPTISLTENAAQFIDSVLRLQPRIAVFDCDGTLWDGDAGEQFLYWELNKRLLPEPTARWVQDRYREYKEGKVSEVAMCGEMVTIHEGLSIEEIQRVADEFFAAKFADLIFPDMLELVTRLGQNGCRLWAVSSTNEWVIRAGTRQFGISQDHILAACVHCERGMATGRLRHVPTDEAKASVIREVIHAGVDAAFGNSIHDAAMLQVASHGFAINPTPELQAIAEQRGWKLYAPMGTAAHQG